MPLLINPYAHAAAGGGPADYQSLILASSPLAYWRMGDPSGTTMTDSSGNARHGTYSGSPTLGTTGLVSGDADTAVAFSGSGQYAQVARAAWMDVTTITVEAIVKFDTVASTQAIAIRDDLATGGRRCFLFRLDSGKVDAIIFRNGGTVVQATGATSLVAGTRYHVAFTYDGTTLKVFLNGAVDGSTVSAGTMDGSSTEPLHIGKTGHSSVFQYLDGVEDEVAYFGTALSPATLDAHATAAGL